MAQALVPCGTNSSTDNNSAALAVVEVFPDEPIVPVSAPGESEKRQRTPVKCRPITSYFTPVTSSGHKVPIIESVPTPASSSTDSPVPASSTASPGMPSPPLVSRESSPGVNIEKKWPFIPSFIRKQKTFNRSINCRGCNKIFLCQVAKKDGQKYSCPEVAYYKHCYECEMYLLLNLTSECDACSSTFLDKAHYIMHFDLGGGRPGQGCRVIAEQNLLKYGCTTTALDSQNKHYFAIPPDAGIVRQKRPHTDTSPSQSDIMTPVKNNKVLAIEYQKGSPSACTAVAPFHPKVGAATIAKKKVKTKVADSGPVLPLSAFKVFAPEAPPGCRKTIINCEGCDMPFRVDWNGDGELFGCKKFYEHCIFLCKEFRNRPTEPQEVRFPRACTRCNQILMPCDDEYFQKHPCSRNGVRN